MSYDSLINQYSSTYGLSPGMLRSFMGIESGGNPYARTGSYKGLFQLSDSEFNKYGGGNVYDPEDNTRAAAAKLAAERDAFKSKYGREPTAHDIYMTHQQGAAGYGAHMASPDKTAWQNIRPYYDSDNMAKKAIWGNVPSDVRAKYPGGVESMTSQQFMDLWRNKVERFGGGGEMENTWMWDNPQPGMTTVDGRTIPNSAAFPNIAKALVGNGGAVGVDPLMVYSAQFPGGGAQTPNRGVTVTAPSAPAPTVGTVNPKLAALLAGLEAPDSTGKSRAERLQNMADSINAKTWMDVAAKGLGSLFGGMAQADAAKEERAYSKKLGEAIAAAGDDPAALRALMTRIAPAKALESAMSPKNHDWRVNAELGVMFDEKTGEVRRIGAGPKTQAELAKMEAETDKYKSEAEKNRSQEPTTEDIKEFKFDMAQRHAAGQPTYGFKQWSEEKKLLSAGTKPGADALKSANFASMMTDAEGKIEGLLGNGESPIGFWGALREAVTPGEDLRNYMRSGEYQQYRQAARQWIRAKLRKESGAAIGKDEEEQEFRTYFPMPGDSEETIKQKRDARAEAARGLIIESNGAYDKLRQGGETSPRQAEAVSPKQGHATPEQKPSPYAGMSDEEFLAARGKPVAAPATTQPALSPEEQRYQDELQAYNELPYAIRSTTPPPKPPVKPVVPVDDDAPYFMRGGR